MTNYSRTTLRELKKRYLNVLKKCLLANLLAFSFMLPSMAEAEIDVYTKETTQEQYIDGGNFQIASNTSKTYENITHFLDNKVTSTNGFVYGGNLYSNGTVTFRDEALFDGTIITGESAQGSAIYNNGGELIFEGSAIFKNNKSIATTKDAVGAIQNWSNGPIIFKKSALFENNSASGVDKGQGGAIYNAVGKRKDDGTIDTVGITFKDTATFVGNSTTGKTSSSSAGAIYNSGTIIFEKDAYFGIKYVSEQDANNNINITQVVNGNTSSGFADSINNTGAIYFQGRTEFVSNTSALYNNNGTINFTASIPENKAPQVIFRHNEGGGIDGKNASSKMTFETTVLFEGNIAKDSGGAVWNGGGRYVQRDTDNNPDTPAETVLDYGVSFNEKVSFFANKVTNQTSGWGGAILNGTNSYIKLGNEYVFSGNKATLGNDIYNLGGHIHFTNGVDEEGDLLVGTLDGGIYNRSGHILKNGSGILVLGDESINNYENKNSVVARFTQTDGLTIVGSHNLALAETHTINGGELKTHGAEIAYKATLGETGTLTHLGTSADTPTEIKGVTFNGTGLNLTLGTYTKAEQEKEIALVGDRLVEYVDDKGTEDTADDELVSYQATDKLFTVNALENDQKAKFILNENLTGMEGNSITVAGAELDVKEGLKVAGKVVAKDMRLSAEKTSSFTSLEVAEKGLLDIQNQTVTADTLSLNQEGAVKVSVHSLSDYGQILAKETVSKGAGTLTMNLVGAPQEGVYKVFESDTDLKLATTHEFLDITDLENGSYKIARKKADELAEKFGLNEEETRAVSAVIGGNSENETFQKVQTEIMETLKSDNKGKAKKALLAVGSKEHPVEQSVASEHLVALQNVVQSEMHGAGVGRAGGEEDPRAKVYIKGLYDRTKSSMGEGFRARSKGAVLGVQSEVTEALTLGVGYATSQTTAKEDLRRTEVDTNTGFVSAHYQPNAWWVSGLATFSRGEYEEEKQILSSMGKASYDVDSWGAQVMTGYDIKLETAIITPEVGLRYLSVKQEGYTDTLGTTVSGTRSDYLTALVGVKGVWDMGAIRPTAGVTIGYDVISDDVSALNTLANGASYTVNGEALDRLSTGVSLGVEADIGERTTLKLEYSGTFRKEYVDHSGMLRLEWRF